jgi:hypothetical protein
MESMVQSMGKSRMVKTLTENLDWRWSDVLCQWQRLHPVEKVWVSDHPPLPEWFILECGVVSEDRMQLIWLESQTFTDVKKQLFWMSVEEVQVRITSLSSVQISVDSTPPEPTVVPDLIGNPDVSTDSYDPMQAVLNSQQNREYRPQRQFETSEGSRFSAKH